MLFVVSAVNMLVVLLIFSPLQVENKPHDGDSTHAFILGRVSLVANSKCSGNLGVCHVFRQKK